MTNWRKILISFLFIASLFASRAVLAQDVNDQALYGGETQKSGLAATLGLSDSDPRIVGANLIRIFLGFLGLVAVGLILYAGWIYMRSQGEAKEIEKSKNILKSAIIGLLVILSAFAIVTFILSNILKATGGDQFDGSDELPGGGWFDGEYSLYMVGSEPTANEMNVFRDQAVILSFNLQLNREIATSSFFELNKVAEYSLTKFETEISTGTASSTANSGPVAITVSTSSDMTSVIIKASSSCESFNGVSTTTYQNCLTPWSKYHLKIKETVVSLNGKELDCNATNHLCEFDFYTNDSFGEGRPVIRSITPVGGFCRQGSEPTSSSTNEACLTTRDCQHWTSSTSATNPDWRCDTVTPNAKAGNFVSISGRNFGDTAGTIEFSNYNGTGQDWIISSTSKSINAACAGWTDSEIVAVMPSGIALDATSSVKITTSKNQVEYNNDKFGPKIKDILLNNIERPGLCQITPNHGSFSSSTISYGQKLLQTWAYMGELDSKKRSTSSADNGSIAQCNVPDGKSCAGIVPNISAGKTSTFVLRGLVYSNFIGFQKDLEAYNGPMITSLMPTTGPKGQYVTIGGSGFGYAAKEQLGFGKGSSSRIALFVKKASLNGLGAAINDFSNSVCRPDNESCTKDFVEASFAFPPICSDDLWKNNQVIVKVPKAIDDGTDGTVGDYYLFLFFPKDGQPGSWLIGSDQMNENNALTDTKPEAKQEYFIANKNALLLPGLCSIRPSTGMPGVLTDVYGEYYPTSAADRNLYFSTNVKVSNASWLGFDPAQKADRATATVPIGAITGSVNIKLGNGSTSNPIDFKVGACKASNECGSGIFCCQSGSAFAGKCQKGADEQSACYSSLRASVFAWSFSTYLSTSSESCSGFTNANACVLTSTCPNSPGTCQSQENTKVVGNECTADSCNKAYPEECQGNKCVYDSVTNHCASTTDGSTIATCSVEDPGYVLPGTNNKKVEAFCNKAVTSIDEKGNETYSFFWQYQPKFGSSCEGSSTLELGGWCTIKDTSGVARTCSSCSKGFDCQAGKCVIGDPICPGKSTCDGSGKCRENFTCECCCKVGNDAQDCCAGLTCTPGLCVNGEKTSDDKYKYGQCSGCKKTDAAGNVDQAASNLACSCNGTNRYCNTEERVYINGEWHDNPNGICTDAAKLNEPCQAAPVNDDDIFDTSSVDEWFKHTVKIWQAEKTGECPSEAFEDFNNKCTVGAKPLTCPTPGLVSTTTIDNATTTCQQVAAGVNYWQVHNQVPCPAYSYLAGNSTLNDGWCTVLSASSPKACPVTGATSSSIVSGSVVTCNETTSNYQPAANYTKKATTTTKVKFDSSFIGNEAYYWQAPSTSLDAQYEGYMDRNNFFTYAPDSPQATIATCTTPGPTATQPIVPGYAKEQFFCTAPFTVGTNSFNVWRFDKLPNATCPENTALMANGVDASMPRCIVSAKPTNTLRESDKLKHLCGPNAVGKTATSSRNITYICTRNNYITSNSGAAGWTRIAYCSDTGLPQCDTSANLYCDPKSCTCQNVSTTTETSEVRAGELCREAAGASCTVGVASCDEPNTKFQCRADEATNGDCRCCCNPGDGSGKPKSAANPNGADTKDVVDSNGNPGQLICLPNKEPCSGGQRGLFCGCIDDNQCNNGADGCGLDTCCSSRPFAVSTYPYGYAGEVGLTSNVNLKPVCRNTQISMTFNGPMDAVSFTGNIIVAGDYGTDLCPNGTTYLTTIAKPSRFAWLNRIFAKVVTFFAGNDSAFAQANRTLCAVEGRVTAEDGGKRIVFSPLKILDYNRVYHVVVVGDANQTNALREGVLNINGIGIHDDDGTGTRHTMGGASSFAFASSSLDVNGRDIFGYTWHFKTKDQAEENQGICLVNSVVVNTKASSTAWVFTTSINNPLDDASGAGFDQVATDSDKDFVAKALTKDNQPIVSIPDLYAWSFGWSSQNTNLIGIRNHPDSLNDHNVAYVVKNQKDAQTTVTAVATINDDKVNIPTTKDKKFSGKANVRVFMCNNPWPPLNDPSAWPWKDSSTNCSNKKCLGGTKSGLACTQNSDCPGGSCPSCDSNNFEFYYCRDAGGPGTADDLPVISSNPVGIGRGQGYCDAGYSYNQTCSDNSGCLEPEKGALKCVNKVCSGGTKLDDSAWPNDGGKCQNDYECQTSGNCKVLLKEFFFGRDNIVGGASSVITVSSSPLGAAANLSWAKVAGATKYKVYYGLQSGKYTSNEAIAATNCNTTTCTATISNLTNDKTYYFAFTSLNNNNTESTYSSEANALIKDSTAPAKPLGVSVSNVTTNSADIAWTANTTDQDLSAYRVYVGHASGNYGEYYTINKSNTKYTVPELTSAKSYYLKVTAVDKSGNESASDEQSFNTLNQ